MSTVFSMEMLPAAILCSGYVCVYGGDSTFTIGIPMVKMESLKMARKPHAFEAETTSRKAVDGKGITSYNV